MKTPPARIPIGETVRVYIDGAYTNVRDKGFGTVVSYYTVSNQGEFGYHVKLDSGGTDSFYFKFVRKLTKLERALK